MSFVSSVKVVKAKETRSELVQKMKDYRPRELEAVWDCRDKEIVVYALDDGDLDSTVKLIETQVVEKAQELQDSEVGPITFFPPPPTSYFLAHVVTP